MNLLDTYFVHSQKKYMHGFQETDLLLVLMTSMIARLKRYAKKHTSNIQVAGFLIYPKATNPFLRKHYSAVKTYLNACSGYKLVCFWMNWGKKPLKTFKLIC